jgi:thymidylate kinase
VALEGLRGCGKSTVAPLLATALGARQMPTFPAELSDARDYLDWQSRNADARAHLFTAALLVTAERIRETLDAGTSVVIDSFLQRTLATHKAFGATLQPALPEDLPVPLTFRLECTAAERQARLRHRCKQATWWDALADMRAGQIEEQYSRFPSHRIETTGQSPEQTAAAIASIIGAGRATVGATTRDTAPACFTRTYPARLNQIRQVRADLRAVLDGCPIADDLLLCASELATNAALHSNSRRPGGTLTVRLQFSGLSGRTLLPRDHRPRLPPAGHRPSRIR